MQPEATAAPSNPASTLDALSVVIPVYNEEKWIRIAVDALCSAASAAEIALDLVIVDDGSTDSTPAVLDDLARSTGARVVHQENAGRFAARLTGLKAASEERVLLLDSRVIVGPESLSWLQAQIAEHPDRRVWSGHVDVETRDNSFALFWAGLVKIGWHRYTRNPRLVSFDLEDFDAYPKGTTCLLMPRDLLLEAMGGFDSLFDIEELSSDDTRLLRYVAGKERIWLSPDFNFVYHGKSGAKGFVKQSYFRGTTFVDSYLGHAGPVRRALLGAIAAGTVTAAVAVRHPRLGLAGAAAAVAMFPSAVHVAGGSCAEVRAAGTLAPAFIPLFGAGVLRGLGLAASAALRARRGAPTE